MATLLEKRIGLQWARITMFGLWLLVLVTAILWAGWMSVQELSRGAYSSGVGHSVGLVVMVVWGLFQALSFYLAMRAGMQPTRSRRDDSVSMLARRIWFYGTWVWLGMSTILTVGFALVLIGAGVILLVKRDLLGLLMLPGGMAILWEFERNRRRFFREVQEGKEIALKRRNLCPHCEYDLRASAGRCPECGRAIVDDLKTIEV